MFLPGDLILLVMIYIYDHVRKKILDKNFDQNSCNASDYIFNIYLLYCHYILKFDFMLLNHLFGGSFIYCIGL